MTREEIIAANPLSDFMASRGCVIRGAGQKRTSNRCAVTEHKPGHFPVTIDTSNQVWFCADCSKGGSVIDFLAIADHLTIGQAMEQLSGPIEQTRAEPRSEPRTTSKQNGSSKIVKTYDYTDEEGRLLYQVVRYEPKDFRQRAPQGDGWTYSLEGVRRVLYNLPKVKGADLIWLTEGEKDADTLNSMGLVATTNAMGAKKWCADYTAQLRGKDVVILPDNDKPGKEHCDLLVKELGPAVKSIRIVPMPEGIKDVSDYVATFQLPKEAALSLFEIAEKAEVLYRGISVPVQTMSEMELAYKAYSKLAPLHQLRLNHWLPSLRSIRPLVPGEILTILAGTGVGKTMILQNIALHSQVHTLLIEVELPTELSFERLAAIATDTTGGHVESMYREGGTVAWRSNNRLDHIVCVHQSRVTPELIKKYIEGTELKTCHRPRVVLIDYVQLIGATGESRYERASLVMEEMKIVARETSTVICIASQVGRKDKKSDSEVGLSDGKDSGSIENSSGVVLGAWRDAEDDGKMWVRVLKNTKGKSGLTIPCRIRDSLRIVEEAETKIVT